jgi:hypothetical protein
MFRQFHIPLFNSLKMTLLSAKYGAHQCTVFSILGLILLAYVQMFSSCTATVSCRTALQTSLVSRFLGFRILFMYIWQDRLNGRSTRRKAFINTGRHEHRKKRRHVYVHVKGEIRSHDASAYEVEDRSWTPWHHCWRRCHGILLR